MLAVIKRGIGATTLSRVQDYADENGLTFYNALKMAEEIGTIGRASAKIRPFVMLIQSMRSKLPYISVSELLQEIIEETGYVRELEAENTEEAQQRMENIDELISKAVTYEESEEEPTLSGFLEEVALVAGYGQPLLGSCDSHIGKTTFFFDFRCWIFRTDCTESRKQSVFHSCQINLWKFKTLRTVQRHQHNIVLCLIHTVNICNQCYFL